MNCQKCKNEIEDRDLRRESLTSVAAAHVAACADCRVFGEERLALRRLVGGLEKVSAPADFDFRMRARMAAERDAVASRASWFNFSPAALSWALAGCLALVVSASLYFQQRRPDAPALPSAEQARVATPAPQASVAAVTPERVQAAKDETRSSDSLNDEARSSDPANREARPGVEAASSNISPSRRQRALPTRLAERAGFERELAQVQVEESNSAALLGSTPRFASGNPARSESALIPVPLDAPEGQLKVLLRDTSGGARTISVDSVSFGSRDVIRRPGATYTPASVSSNQGVW
ncbi:MAG TPA: hypothetical protein VGX24_13110 [Pyrinomonadaceae bacterium]|jgi:hypothetical protein|nr:hypothetical protein [Pyrinomonadaceae bacterium]